MPPSRLPTNKYQLTNYRPRRPRSPLPSPFFQVNTAFDEDGGDDDEQELSMAEFLQAIGHRKPHDTPLLPPLTALPLMHGLSYCLTARL